MSCKWLTRLMASRWDVDRNVGTSRQVKMELSDAEEKRIKAQARRDYERRAGGRPQ